MASFFFLYPFYKERTQGRRFSLQLTDMRKFMGGQQTDLGKKLRLELNLY
jgi:hypothetical protein